MKVFASKIGRRLQRTGLGLLFRLYYRHRHAHLRLEKAAGLDLLIPPAVFNPNLFGSSLFLAEYLRTLKLPPTSSVLDIGCGSGLLGLVLAKRRFQVIATDINPEAVWAAGVNAHLNGLDNYHTTRQGSLYKPVEADGLQFDLITMNPPYYAHSPRNLLDHAFQAGPELEILVAMLSGSAQHLKPTGQALAVLSSTIPLQAKVWPSVEQAGLAYKLVAQRRYWAEDHLIYELRHQGYNAS